MDERCVPIPLCSPRDLITRTAAYQVGLSYLSMGMRRAVAACTSPEVFFGNAPLPQPLLSQGYNTQTDALNMAMEALGMGGEGAYPSTFQDV